MIADALPIRLLWTGRSGCVSADGVHIRLTQRPAGLMWCQVDYAPGVVAICRDRECDPERDLLPDEAAAIAAYLVRVAALARSGL